MLRSSSQNFKEYLNDRKFVLNAEKRTKLFIAGGGVLHCYGRDEFPEMSVDTPWNNYKRRYGEKAGKTQARVLSDMVEEQAASLTEKEEKEGVTPTIEADWDALDSLQKRGEDRETRVAWGAKPQDR